MNTTSIKSLINLTRRKKEIDTELKEIEREIRFLGPQIVEDMIDNEMQKLTIDGATVYLRTQLWARATRDDPDSEYASEFEQERACEALEAAGLGDLVKPRFNVHSLSAEVRRMTKAGEPIPPEFEGAINVTQNTEPRVLGA